jgi:uncharacterized protein YggE
VGDSNPAHRQDLERTITVQGFGLAAVVPDAVRLRLTIRQDGDAPDATLAEASRRTRVLEELLGELGHERWSTSIVTVAEQRVWDDKKRRDMRIGYIATSAIDVELEDPAGAGHLMAEAATRAEAQVAGPWWHVRPENPAQDEAGRGAIDDARHKAEVLAAALGAGVGAALSISEPAMTGVGGRFVARASSPRVPSHLAEGEEMSMQARSLEVGASVEVRFELVLPE